MELKILITISAEFLNFLNAQRFPLRRLEVNFNALFSRKYFILLFYSIHFYNLLYLHQ